MSRTGKVTGVMGGGEYEFCLRWGELIELQESRDGGPQWLLARMAAGQWQVQDVREVLRLGLIGAGTPTSTALRMVKTHVEQKPFDLGGENGLLILAAKVLAAALHGVEDEVPKSNGEAVSESTTFPEARSDSPPSSALAP